MAATGPEGSLDAAITGWVRATVDVVTSRQRVTQTALQVAAGDALILTAAAGTVCASAAQLGVVDAGRAGVAGVVGRSVARPLVAGAGLRKNGAV